MVRIIVNVVLFLIIIALAFMLVNSINEPIKFKAEKARRTEKVVEKLKQIRIMQEFYREVTGQSGVAMYADNFDTLFKVLRNAKIRQIAVIGDPDDPNFDGVIRYDTTYKSVFDTLLALGINLDSANYYKTVPFSEGVVFEMNADTILYQKTPRVPVVMTGTRIKNYMGAYADPKYATYDKGYDPDDWIKFGDLGSPNTSGNWE